jgi:hypothetical protein
VRIEPRSSRSLHAGDILKTVVPKISQKNGDVNLYLQLRDLKTNARCDISGTVTELSNGKWNDKKVKQNVIF